MEERPILFNGPMIRAILAGQKTVTRRVVRWRVQGFGGGLTEPTDHPGAPTYEPRGGHTVVHTHPDGTVCGMPVLRTPAMPGDTLWVRETWRPDTSHDPDDTIYRADGSEEYHDLRRDLGIVTRWRPAIHMPRIRSRITLRVADVRIERLHAIDDDDAACEGIEAWTKDGVVWKYGLPDPPSGPPTPLTDGTARDAFAVLWDAINGKRAPWSSNPWVWRVAFERVTP